MGNRKPRKPIGYGPLDWEGNINSKVWLRNEFLRTIERLEPTKQKKPLGDLAEPLDQYSRYMEDIPRRQGVSERFSEKRKTLQEGERVSLFSLLDQDDPFRASVRQWGETYHLNSTWCYDVVLRTLQHWHEFKETAGKRFTPLPFYSDPNYVGFAYLVGLARTPRNLLTEEQKAAVDSFDKRQLVHPFTERERDYLSAYPPDDPHIMIDDFSLNEAESYIEEALSSPVFKLLSTSRLAEFRGALREEAKKLLDKVKATAKREGAVKPMEVDEVSKHLEWAVSYQVFDESYYSIEAHKYINATDKHRAAVKIGKQARHILKLVDLKPRPTTKGRSRDL